MTFELRGILAGPSMADGRSAMLKTGRYAGAKQTVVGCRYKLLEENTCNG